MKQKTTNGVAVIGYGGMGHYHCNGIRAADGLKLAGICDLSPECRQKAAEKYGVRTWSSIEECLAADEVDVVILVLPNDLHLPIGVKALRAGKHVVVEKPMALTFAECRELIDAAKANNRLLTVHQNRRWDNDFLAIKQAISQGRAGKVMEIEASLEGYFLPGGWRSERAKGGGILYDWGAHKIDQMLGMLPGAAPVQVFGEIHYDDSRGVNIALAGMVYTRMSDGSHISYRFSHVAHHSPRPLWYVSGSDGAMVMNNLKEPVTLYKHVAKGMETTTFPGQVIEPEPENWFRFYFNLSAALQGKEELAVKPEESALVVRIIESAIISAREKKLVDL
ncbi:MAG: Gfo/Idh/MocA family oxidoreductase [Kiritimatiellota bacterium]|nr:Gfo/Idh/MocA family oxidoreductase [Kiritimatiellota bacterium]